MNEIHRKLAQLPETVEKITDAFHGKLDEISEVSPVCSITITAAILPSGVDVNLCYNSVLDEFEQPFIALCQRYLAGFDTEEPNAADSRNEAKRQLMKAFMNYLHAPEPAPEIERVITH
jgi:hypothetical protein